MEECGKLSKGVRVLRIVVLLCVSTGSAFADHSVDKPVTSSSVDRVQDNLKRARSACKSGEHSRAIALYQRALGLDPACFDAYFELGNVRYAIGDVDEAIHCYRKALELRDHSAVRHNMGLSFKAKGRADEAIEQFKEAVKQRPDYAKAYIQCALLLKEKNEKQEALNVLLQAVAGGVRDSLLAREIGTLYQEFGLFDQAEEQFREALAIDPNNTTAMMQLANALCTRDNCDEAIQLYTKVLERNPSAYSALYNLAYALKRQGNVEAAVEILLKVIDNQPENAQAHFSLGLSYLALGDFYRGWFEYEWRWDAYGEKKRLVGNSPLWEGKSLSGLRILLTAEQGLGDTLQFIRYAKLLHDQGAYVVFLSQKPLKTLLQTGCDYIDMVVAPGDTIPAVDVQLPLMSLPLLMHTDVETVPADIPYIHADPELVDYWRERLSDNINIGICWNGNSNYRSQHLKQVVAAKSVALATFARLAEVSGCTFYSLQKVTGVDQLEAVRDIFVVHDFGPDLDEAHGRFMDTAAIVENLDVVITVDTSTSHLAAALGTETWILLPTPADWRWMVLDEWQAKTPWYPNVRLFRQPTVGDWDSLMEDVAQELERFVQCRRNGMQYNAADSTANSKRKKHISEERKALPIKSEPVVSTNAKPAVASELVDDLTMRILRGDIDPEEGVVNADQEALMVKYQELVQKEPSIRRLTQGLLAANSYLFGSASNISEDCLLDASATERLLVNMHCAHTLKRAIKEEIDQLMS